MKIVIAPDSFKESADAVRVAAAIARGVGRALPQAVIDSCPMADGGQGTVAAMVAATSGVTRTAEVAGPLYQPVQATFGLVGAGAAQTAVIEMAAASGLELLPPAMRNPMLTTTYGTGQLIAAAMDCGVRRIIIGIGGSATNDGGAGMAQAMGFRFYDHDGQLLPSGLSGGQLSRIARIDGAHRDPRLGQVDIVAACDVTNPMTGPNGASAVYGPQKGATAEMIPILDDNLSHLASLMECYLGVRVADLPGAGAAGGLGGGLVGFCGATLRRGVEIVIEATGLAHRLRGADLCITGEGRLDFQSLYGKTAIGVARLAKGLGVPTIAIVGSAVNPGATQAQFDCLDAYYPITPHDMPLGDAFARVGELLEAMAERVMRERLGKLAAR